MSKHEKTSILDYSIGLDLLRFENVCYYELIKRFVDIFNSEKGPLIYGIEEGLDAYFSSGLQLDTAVFLYEAVKHMGCIAPKETEAFMSTSEFKILETVRNNIHTFFKKGNYASKAGKIIDNALEEYKLKEPDYLFALRNDISLAFEITDHTRQLVGCDYFIKHCLFECDSQKWCEEDYRNFGKYVSSNIKRLAETVDETSYQLQSLLTKEKQPQIELFDYKSYDLFYGSKLSNATAFRLMLMIFQISYGILLVEKILSSESYINDDLWVCFISKLLSVKYDESIDNLLSLLQYSSTEDKTVLSSILSETDFDVHNLQARDFARDLRNTIHYQELQYDSTHFICKTTREYIMAIYLSNTKVQTMQDFRDKAQLMFNEMKELQIILRKIMNVDKTYSF
ncbi:MAG: hypothetical protein IJO36_03785 [Clostridia bacterium]|nr:hypothetical protein [Clostridia bacterium]